MNAHALRVKAVFTVAGIVAAIGIASAQAPPEAASAAALLSPWNAVAAAGQVEAHSPAAADEAWCAVARGDRLSPQTTVRTGRKGRATLARNGSILIVDRDSRIDLPAVVEAGTPSSVTQTQGRVVYKIAKGDSRHFEVVTPYLVAGVKGTTFMVTVKDDTASVSVREGLVEVTSAMTGERTDVRAGETVLLGHESESRMELVSSQPGDKGGRDRKSERNDRARDDAARMASLLEPHDAQRDAADADGGQDRVDELAGVAGVDAAGEPSGLADEMKRSGGDRADIEPGIDALRDPFEGLPGDVTRDPGTGISDPVPPPGSSGPGAGPHLPGPGRSGPGATDTVAPGEPQARRPSGS